MAVFKRAPTSFATEGLATARRLHQRAAALEATLSTAPHPLDQANDVQRLRAEATAALNEAVATKYARIGATEADLQARLDIARQAREEAHALSGRLLTGESNEGTELLLRYFAANPLDANPWGQKVLKAFGAPTGPTASATEPTTFHFGATTPIALTATEWFTTPRPTAWHQMERVRGLEAYADEFGQAFLDAIDSVGARGGAWLDVGTGQAKALLDFRISNMQFSGRLDGIDLHPLEPAHANGVKTLGIDFRATSLADFARTAPDEQYDVVTGLYGAESYEGDVHTVLNDMGRVLKTGGDLFLATCDGRMPGDNVILDERGAATPMVDWLASIDGLELIRPSRKDDGRLTLHFKKRGPVVAPALELVGVLNSLPPYRVWRRKV